MKKIIIFCSVFLLLGFILYFVVFSNREPIFNTVISIPSLSGDNGIITGIVAVEEDYIKQLIKKNCIFGDVYSSYSIDPRPITILSGDVFYLESNGIYTNISRGCSSDKSVLVTGSSVFSVNQKIETNKYIRYDFIESGVIVKTERYFLKD